LSCGLDGCGAGAIRFEGWQVMSPKTTRSFDEVVKLAYANRIQLWSDGFYRTPKIHYDKTTLTGRPFDHFAYGAACTEVAIDTLTGENKRAQGGRPARRGPLHQPGHRHRPDRRWLCAGHGLAHHRAIGVERQGATWPPMHPAPTRFPRRAMSPQHFKVDLWPEPNREDNVFGSKAVGEPPFMLAISVYEALRDAIAQARGGSHPVALAAPATAGDVLRALQRVRTT